MAGGKESKKGKKQRKFGRNSRKPGALRQTLRTTRNKERRVLRECKKAERAEARGLATYIAKHGPHAGKVCIRKPRPRKYRAEGYNILRKDGATVAVVRLVQ